MNLGAAANKLVFVELLCRQLRYAQGLFDVFVSFSALAPPQTSKPKPAIAIARDARKNDEARK